MRTTIELKNEKREYQPGEVVEGVFEVVTDDKAIHNQNIRIALGWFTHGQGNPDSSEVDAVQHQEDKTLAVREVYRFPFRLTVPSQPPAYAGKALSIAYRVVAHIDVPWAVDSQAIAELRVAEPRVGSPFTFHHDHKPEESPAAKFLGWGGALLGVSAVGKAVGWWTRGALGPLLLICGIVGVLLLKAGLRHRRRDGKIGRVDLRIEHVKGGGYRSQQGLGQLAVELQTTRKVADLLVSATLLIEEHALSGSGSSQRTFNEVLYQVDATLRAIAPGRYACSLDFPKEQTMPPSFYRGHNSLRWLLRLKIELPDGLDWSKTVRLDTVREALGLG